jgi:hypothetical protein
MMLKTLVGICICGLFPFVMLAGEILYGDKWERSIPESGLSSSNTTSVTASRLPNIELEEHSRKFQDFVLEQMRLKGESPDRIASQKERFQLDNAKVQLKNWEDWTNYYHAQILTPPIVFDMCDPCEYNFTEPVAAFRSYMVASAKGDANTVLKCADGSQLLFLKKMGIDSSAKAGSFALTNVMTTQVVLMSATTKLEGKEYTLVFFRSQDRANPKKGNIGLHSTIFLIKDGKYFVTKDLEDSSFGDVLFAARASGSMIWDYQEFLTLMQKSQLPTNFYHIN